MRSETNQIKVADQERSKHHKEKRRDRSVSPSYHSNQRRQSVSDDDDDLSHLYNARKTAMSQAQDDDDENYAEEGEDYVSDTDYMVQWTGPRKNMPVVLFRADAILEKESTAKCVGEKYHLAFKIVRTECKIVRSVLVSHGFHEVHPNSLDFNVMWTGSHIKPYVLRGFSEFQKVNHFPRSYELTRKDRLCKNVQRMQHLRGFKHFDFIPLTFITPMEFGDFQSTFAKEKGVWIVKPVASSRGRGIFLINHPSQVPMDETLIVSRYINNPLLIDDFKFDIRIYVLVTSYDPLIIYLYEEGLARFASQKFDKSSKSVKNQFMHLTNYSVNKRNPDFVKNADPELEDYGNKWSMSAMLRYLKSIGHDTASLMMRIEDLIVKTFLAGEMAIASASNMFQPFRGNCFELYGFDVLVDENMKPWLMEVNLSPSLACDAPIDLKIKANMISDLFSVVGVTAQDPVSRRLNNRREFQSRSAVRQQIVDYIDNISERYRAPPIPKRGKPYLDYCPLLKQRAANNGRGGKGGGGAPFAGKRGAKSENNPNVTPLTNEEAKILRMAREEYGRRGRWIRIFPTQISWENYGGLMEHRTTHNLMLFTKLYPNGRAKSGTGAPARPTSGYPSANRPKSAVPMYSFESGESSTNPYSCEIISRVLQYERRLMTLAESRAVSAANGNRRVNSESVALSMSNTHSNEVAPTAQSLANGTRRVHFELDSYTLGSEVVRTMAAPLCVKIASTSPDKHPSRSRSRLMQGQDSSAGSQHSRPHSRSTSNGSTAASKKHRVQPSTSTKGPKSERQKEKRQTRTVGHDTAEDVSGRRNAKTGVTVGTSDKSTEPMQIQAPRQGHRRHQEIAVYNVSADGTRSNSRSGSHSRSSSGSRSGSRNSGRGSRSGSGSGSGSSSFNSDNDSRASSSGSISTQQSKEQLRSLLEQGHIFTVTQARLAFAAYLVRVHQRLLRESQNSGNQGMESLGNELKKDSDHGSDAQMDLVLRFLKRAAQNLSQVFRVVVPSKKLSIQDRRRILAKQLSDFVSIYAKDTQTISAQEKKTKLTKIPISEGIFQQFLDISNENDLEEVLTLFTKINRSASIFLGGIQQLSQHQNGAVDSQRDSTSIGETEDSLATQTANYDKQHTTTGASTTMSDAHVVANIPERATSSHSRGDHFDNADNNSGRVATVGLALESTANTPLGDKMVSGMLYGNAAVYRRPPHGAVSTSDKGTKPPTPHEWQRDRSVERRDRSVEREIFLTESTSSRVEKSETIQTRLAFDSNSSNAVSNRPSRLMERSPASRMSNASSHGAPFVSSPSPSGSLERPYPGHVNSSTQSRGGGPSSSMSMATEVSGPSASGDVMMTPNSIAQSSSRTYRNSQSEGSTTMTVATSNTTNTNRTTTNRVSSAKAVATPMNRGKKPRPYSAQLDAAARIYSENLTKTMIPITMTGAHSKHSSSHHQPQTIYHKSEDAISNALQRLAKRQATRQYAASNASTALAAGRTTDEGIYETTPRENSGDSSVGRRGSDDINAHASAYSIVTGVAASSSYQATPGSTQFEVVQAGRNSATSGLGGGGGGGRLSRPSSGVSSSNSPYYTNTSQKRSNGRTPSATALTKYQGRTHSTVNTSEYEAAIPSGGTSSSLSSSSKAANASSITTGFEDSPYYTRPTRASSASRRSKAALTNSHLNNR
ncbi:uncharacterized protein LOC142358558 isoform X5 [Convolutriloba macropyga]|uniref:uncharacterized protein LOC142358558 isoform X5 n=1 Tax=Convolutriloba macropyga TaxID=536237 RepID=UPI003F5253A3